LKTFLKGHPNQKGGCPDTLDTAWIRLDLTRGPICVHTIYALSLIFGGFWRSVL